MPHNIYLHSALVQSRKLDRSNPNKVREANKYFSIEASIALFVSFLINLAVVSVFAKAFFSIDANDPLRDCAPQGLAYFDGKCQSIGLSNADKALSFFNGKTASYIWAAGLLAAGQSSTMTGTFAGQYVMEGFLSLKVSPWVRTAVTRTIALGPAVMVALASSRNTTVGDSLDEWLNVLQSIQLPFALIPILHFTSMKKIMGRFKNAIWLQTICWIFSLGVIGINVFLVASFLFPADTTPVPLPPLANVTAAPTAAPTPSPVPNTWYFYTTVAVLSIFYFGFIFALVKEDFGILISWARDKCGARSQTERPLGPFITSILRDDDDEA